VGLVDGLRFVVMDYADLRRDFVDFGDDDPD
jgi:hypothetical protein